MSENTRRALTTKVHLYQALYLFNRGFEITLAGLNSWKPSASSVRKI